MKQPKSDLLRTWAPAAILSVALALAAGALTLDRAGAQTRSLWSPSEARFLRSWEIVGPFAVGLDRAAVSGESALAPSSNPVPGQRVSRHWTRLQSWGDLVDIAEHLRTPSRRGANAPEEAAFAFATVERAFDGDAVFSFGADGGARIWVNGEEAHRREASPFSFDADRIRVRLKAGPNRILLKLTHRTGPWRFALRVLEPGARIGRIDEIVPHIVSSAGDELVLRTDIENRSQGAPVDIAIVRAGGRIAAERAGARGELVRFATNDWPDGAYEIRFATRDEADAPRFFHLPWYNGDALAAAANLFAVARSPREGLDAGHLAMLAALARDRLGGDAGNAPDDAWALMHAPLMEFEELLLDARGETGRMRPHGFARLAWRDETDGSTQFCSAYLPADYNGRTARPLVVYLHGFNPANPPYIAFWRVDRRHDPIAERMGVIWIETHGRANTQYEGIGESDVLSCIAEARRRLAVDEERVYLTGESMGGAGTWRIASRHPEVFAAIAPISGGWDERVVPGPFNINSPYVTSPPEHYAQELRNSFAGAEALLNVPIFVHHGDDDRVVNVFHSRHAVRQLEAWGYNIRYREHRGSGHGDLKVFDQVVEWMLTHRRNAALRRVRIHAFDLGGASAHWASVRGFEEPMAPIQVDAEILAPGRIRLDTRNVARIVLNPPETARSRSPANQIRVTWNGAEHVMTLPASGEIVLASANATAHDAGLVKRPGAEGGLSRFIAAPFAVVVGTSSRDPEMRRLIAEKAETFSDLWMQWQHVRPRVILDRDLTRQDERAYSLMLLGGTESNSASRRLAGALPMRVRSDSVIIGERAFAVRDAVAQMIYPNPANPDRSVLLVASTSKHGMRFWNPAAFWDPIHGYPTLPFDWTIRDARRLSPKQNISAYRGWVAAGVFDARWRSDDRYVFEGDPHLRARARLVLPPAPGFRLASELLDAYAGRYQLSTEAEATIAREGDGLVLRISGAAPQRLAAMSETEFLVSSDATLLTFRRAARDRVFGFDWILDGFNRTQPERPLWARKRE